MVRTSNRWELVRPRFPEAEDDIIDIIAFPTSTAV